MNGLLTILLFVLCAILLLQGERVYRSLSVSACDWMPTEEVKVEYMLLYLRQKRREGYVLSIGTRAGGSMRIGGPITVLQTSRSRCFMTGCAGTQ